MQREGGHAGKGKGRFSLWHALYFVIYAVVAFFASYLFNYAAAPFISASIPNSVVSSLINNAIVINGIILGFVLVVLDANVKEFRRLQARNIRDDTRVTVFFIDFFTVINSVYGLVGEMFGLIGVSTSTVSQLDKALFLPVSFGIYVVFRFVILLVGEAEENSGT